MELIVAESQLYMQQEQPEFQYDMATLGPQAALEVTPVTSAGGSPQPAVTEALQSLAPEAWGFMQLLIQENTAMRQENFYLCPKRVPSASNLIPDYLSRLTNKR